MAQLQIPAVAPFNPNGEPSAIAQTWRKWKQSFNYFILASGVTNNARQKAMLLHLAGPATQDIFHTLTPADNTYEAALNTLDTHFAIRKNVPFERSIFHKAKQNQGESTDQYITRLRQLSAHCEYTDVSDQICDQFIASCSSTKLRKKLLTESNLTLQRLIDIAKAEENASLHNRQIESNDLPGDSICKISHQQGTSRSHSNNNRHHPSSRYPKQRGGKQENQPPSNNNTCNRCGA